MNRNLRKTLLAGAIAALISAPTWAADEASGKANAEPETSHQEAPTALGNKAGRVSAAGDKQLHARTPGELEGKEVVDASGKKIGTIQNVVFDSEKNEIFAVISAGASHGKGTGGIAVPFDELQMSDDGEILLSSTHEQMEDRGDATYTEERYVELENDVPISEFSAFESGDSTTGLRTGPESGRGAGAGAEGGMSGGAGAGAGTSRGSEAGTGAGTGSTAPAAPR